MDTDAANRMREITKHLKTKDLSPGQISSMVASIAVETGYTFDPNTAQQGERTDPAYGLFQFDPRGSGLLPVYKQYLADTGSDDSAVSQLDFMVDSLQGKYKAGTEHIGYGNAAKWRGAQGAEDSLEVFTDSVLRPGVPHKDRRQEFMEQLNRGDFS